MSTETGEPISDRRDFERVGVIASAQAANELKIDRANPATVCNISEAGMYIETDADIQEGDMVYIRLEQDLPEKQGKEHYGQVRWKKALDALRTEAYGYGIELITK